MKILHVLPSYIPARRYGGPIYSVHALCKSLSELGHDVHVFTTNIDGDGASAVELDKPVNLDGVKVWYFSCPYILKRLYYSPALKVALEKQIRNFDIVHIHSIFLWPTLVAARISKAVGIPYLISPRGMLVKSLIKKKNRLIKTIWLELFEKNNLTAASAIHTTSDIETDELKKINYDYPIIFTLPNGVDFPGDWSTADINDDIQSAISKKPYVLFLGRINWKKGLDRLIRCWEDITDVNLIIAGNDEENYLPELQDIASLTNVNKKVIFIPRSVTGADKEALYAHAQLFALASYSENFGNTVLEAMIRKLPVVVTEEVGACEIVKQANAGLVVPGKNLKDAIITLLKDETTAKEYGARGHAWVKEKYQWSDIGKNMIINYQNIIKNYSGINRQ